MFFRNLQIYRSAEPGINPDQLQEQLSRSLFQPCSSYARDSRGWIPPRGDDRLVFTLEQQQLIALGTESKLLPASVVRQAVEERAADIEKRMGVKPGRKRLRELKDEITDELLPRAFSRYTTTFAWIDPVNHWFIVDAGSPKTVESFMEVLRKSLDEVIVIPLKTERSATAAMTEWLIAREAPPGFSIDRECELQSTLDEKATVRYLHHPLTDTAEIVNHIRNGKVPTRLAMTWQDRISFVLTGQMEVKRVAFLEVATAGNETDGASDDERFEADFALMTGMLAKFLDDLMRVIGIAE